MPKFIDFEKEYEEKQRAWRESPAGKKWTEENEKCKKELERSYSDPAKQPWKDMVWNKRKKRWVWPPPSAEERRRRLREKRETERRHRIWEDVENRIPPGWGAYVACGLGWKEIILQLTRDIDRVWDGFAGHRGRDCWIPLQVKEKFGGLRFGICDGFRLEKGDSKKLAEDASWRGKLTGLLISNAEHESIRTCEECGVNGYGVQRRSVANWIGTVCPGHYQEWLEHRFKEERERNPKVKIESLMDDFERARIKEAKKARRK